MSYANTRTLSESGSEQVVWTVQHDDRSGAYVRHSRGSCWAEECDGVSVSVTITITLRPALTILLSTFTIDNSLYLVYRLDTAVSAMCALFYSILCIYGISWSVRSEFHNHHQLPPTTYSKTAYYCESPP